ncbi:MAG: TylF/MycF/NovP-related O-methyltransferase [Patescibacteria group bacterium]
MNFEEIYKIAGPYTVTGANKMRKLYESVIYINENNIAGDYVECGVYKGGSVMNMALTQLNYDKRVDIYLYDTYEGMTPHTEDDVNHQGVSARRILKIESKKCIYSLQDVMRNVNLTGYPIGLLHYIKGDVAITLEQETPEKIALLRLDTDWYESTKVGLEKLYPKLVKGGVLILDDYGYWLGSRKATDEYFSSIGVKPQFKPMESGVSGVVYIKE